MKLSLDVVKKDAKENNLNVIQSGISWNEEKGRKSKMFDCLPKRYLKHIGI